MWGDRVPDIVNACRIDFALILHREINSGNMQFLTQTKKLSNVFKKQQKTSSKLLPLRTTSTNSPQTINRVNCCLFEFWIKIGKYWATTQYLLFQHMQITLTSVAMHSIVASNFALVGQLVWNTLDVVLDKQTDENYSQTRSIFSN